MVSIQVEMTYHIRYGVECLRIPRHGIPRALLKLNLLWRQEKQHIIANYLYINLPINDTFTSIDHAFRVFGFFTGQYSSFFINDEGDIIISGLSIKKLEYEEIILRELATCIDDCFIEVVGDDDGFIWEWMIEDGVFYKFVEPRDVVLNMEGLKIGEESLLETQHTSVVEPKTPTGWDTL